MDNTRRIYLDNIRWITVCIVVIYHVIYMYNGVQPFGVIAWLYPESVFCGIYKSCNFGIYEKIWKLGKQSI